MPLPLMPKATAVWLVENTTLSFEQIAEFCGMHSLEIQAIADGEVAAGIQGLDPVASGQLTSAEILRCQASPHGRLKLQASTLHVPVHKPKGTRYTPISKRGDKPDAVAWVLKNHPEVSDMQLSKLLGTTKQTIQAVRDKSHWNAAAIKPRHPVSLGLCSQGDLDVAIDKAKRAGHKAEPVTHYDSDEDDRPSF